MKRPHGGRLPSARGWLRHRPIAGAGRALAAGEAGQIFDYPPPLLTSHSDNSSGSAAQTSTLLASVTSLLLVAPAFSWSDGQIYLHHFAFSAYTAQFDTPCSAWIAPLPGALDRLGS